MRFINFFVPLTNLLIFLVVSIIILSCYEIFGFAFSSLFLGHEPFFFVCVPSNALNLLTELANLIMLTLSLWFC